MTDTGDRTTGLKNAFPGFKDRGEHLTDPDWDARVRAQTDHTKTNGLDVIEVHHRLGEFRHRTVNGYKDPLCAAIVVGALLESHPTSYIRSSYLRLWLNRRYPQFIWDTSTVGRIFGELAGSAEVGYGEAGRQDVPFAQGRDYKGAYLVLNGKDARGYLGKVFLSLAAIADAEMRKQRVDGDITINRINDNPWEEADFSPLEMTLRSERE